MERQHLRHELAETQLWKEPNELPKALQDRSAVQQQQAVLAQRLLLPVQQEEQVVQAGTQRPRQAQQAVASYQRGVEGGVAVLREAEEDAEQLVGQPAVEGAGEEERGGGGQRIADDVRGVEERVGHIRVMFGLQDLLHARGLLRACDLLDDGIGALGEESFEHVNIHRGQALLRWSCQLGLNHSH